MNDIKNINTLWWRKYVPQTLDDLVLNQHSKEILKSFSSKQDIPHLLFCGSSGLGKTVTAKMLAKNILEADYLYINASEENGIDVIRTKIMSFAQTKSFNGNIKVIILDEFSGTTSQAQDALKNVMEEYSDNVRFILTANQKHKIIEPIQSRCQSIDFEFTYSDYYKRCVDILIKEKVKVPSDQIPLLKTLTKSYFPDFRKSINEMQKFSSNGVLNIGNVTVSTEFITQVFNKIKDDVFDCRQYVIQNENVFQADYHALMKSLLNYIYTLQLGSLIKRECLCIIANHMDRHSVVIDTEINAFNCFMRVSKELNV